MDPSPVKRTVVKADECYAVAISKEEALNEFQIVLDKAIATHVSAKHAVEDALRIKNDLESRIRQLQAKGDDESLAASISLSDELIIAQEKLDECIAREVDAAQTVELSQLKKKEIEREVKEAREAVDMHTAKAVELRQEHAEQQAHKKDEEFAHKLDQAMKEWDNVEKTQYEKKDAALAKKLAQ